MKSFQKLFTYQQQLLGANISPLLYILKSPQFTVFVPDNISNTHLTIFQLFMHFVFLKEDYEIVQPH